LGIQISKVFNSKIGLDAPVNTYFNSFWGFSQFENEGFSYPGFYNKYEIGETNWNIEVVDLKNANKNKKLNVIWNAQISGNQIFDEINYDFLIDKIFEISTFLPQTK
jgi:hypothetical protein